MRGRRDTLVNIVVSGDGVFSMAKVREILSDMWSHVLG